MKTITDKAGEEIYEGDILLRAYKDGYKALFLVKQADGELTMEPLTEHRCDGYTMSDCKIIGNIHERAIGIGDLKDEKDTKSNNNG